MGDLNAKSLISSKGDLDAKMDGVMGIKLKILEIEVTRFNDTSTR